MSGFLTTDRWDVRRAYIGWDPSPLRRSGVCDPRSPPGMLKMRYKERSLQLIDLIGRFEARSSTDRCYNAIAALQRLRDDGRDYWKSDPQALARWNRGCNVLLEFLNILGARTKQPLATVMREFVQEFEPCARVCPGQLSDRPRDHVRCMRSPPGRFFSPIRFSGRPRTPSID